MQNVKRLFVPVFWRRHWNLSAVSWCKPCGPGCLAFNSNGSQDEKDALRVQAIKVREVVLENETPHPSDTIKENVDSNLWRGNGSRRLPKDINRLFSFLYIIDGGKGGTFFSVAKWPHFS